MYPTMAPGASAADDDLYLYNSAGTLPSTYYVGVRYDSGATGITNGKYALPLIW